MGEPLPRPNIRVSEAEFPPGVYQILERRCGTCHTYGERDPAGWGSALDLSRMIASDVVVPGNPDASRLYNRVAVRADMPYNGARLSSAEVQTLRAWIANLQRPAPESPRSQRQILDALVQDQNAQRNIPASDLRYLSFAHFADERRAPEELQAAEAVLALTLNSLSRRSTMVKLEAVDAGRTVFRFRLSRWAGAQDEWDALIAFYPYCLRSDQIQPPHAVPAPGHRGALRARRLVPGHRHPAAAVRTAAGHPRHAGRPGRRAGRGHQPQHQPPRPDPPPERDAHRVPQLGRVRPQPDHGTPQPGATAATCGSATTSTRREDRADIRENPLGPDVARRAQLPEHLHPRRG